MMAGDISNVVMWWTDQEKEAGNDNDDDDDDDDNVCNSREFRDYLWCDVFISQNFVQFGKNVLLNLGMCCQVVQTPGHH